MGDDSESDAEPTANPDGHDDAPVESDEAPDAPGTSEDSETSGTSETSETPDPSELQETVDDALSADAADTADGDTVDTVDTADTDDEQDSEHSEPLDSAGSSDSLDASESTESAETADESPLQPEHDGVDGDDTPYDAGEQTNDSGLTPVDAERNGEDVGAPNESGTDTEEPLLHADSPALEDSEGGYDDADEAFAAPNPEADSTEQSDLPGAFGNIEAPEDDFSTPDSFVDDGIVGEGPDTDQEMPLADHIEEMVRRLAVVFIIGGGIALTVFGLGESLQYAPSTVEIINFLWNKHIPGAGEPGNELLRPHIYGPLELILTKLKVASLVGVVVGLPVFVYQSYLFMRPGLYENERKYYLASVPTSLILAVIGVAFAHFVVLPSIFAYFTSYTVETAVIAFGLAETFNLILILMGYMAIVFQIPLFIMLAIMMNLVTREWLEDKRLIFWGAFLGLAFLVSPDPTGMAPIIIAITMVVLFEGTLLLLRWTGN